MTENEMLREMVKSLYWWIGELDRSGEYYPLNAYITHGNTEPSVEAVYLADELCPPDEEYDE